MVYEDISAPIEFKKENDFEHQASVFQRLLAVLLDYFILVPLISFFCVSLFSQGLSLYKKFPRSLESNLILFQVGFGFVFLFTMIQALCIFLVGSTPGQFFTKTYVEFENKNSSLFFQAWIRQLGFLFSVVLFGFPFLAVFYHPRRAAFYERMTESSVLTKVKHSFNHYSWGAVERRYVSAFISVFSFCVLVLSVMSFKHFYQKTVSSNLTFEKYKKEQNFCKELEPVAQENRLNVATALNLLGVLSDDCLDKEADFVLWHNFSDLAQIELKSAAYFAKYLTARTDDEENLYLNQVCSQNNKSQACSYSKAFIAGDFEVLLAEAKAENKRSDSENVLSSVFIYESEKELGLNQSDSLAQIQKFSELKPISKFIVSEKLNQLQFFKNRQPASDISNEKNQIQDILNLVDQL